MTAKTSPDGKCTFVSADGRACRDTAAFGYEFCEHHLWALTRENVKAAATELISRELRREHAEVTDGARFIEDLGADSLDTSSMVMAIEEVFGFNVPDHKADTLLTVGQAVEHVMDVLQANNTPMPYPDKGIVEAADRRALKSRQSERIQNQILRSELFRRYYELLGLEPERVEWLYRRTVRDERVYQVTSIPDTDGAGGRLNGVNVLFLGKDRIYHFDLRPDFLGFEWAALSDLMLTYEIHLGPEGEVSKVVVQTSSRDAAGLAARAGFRRRRGKGGRAAESLRDATFEFEGDEIEAAMEFLTRFLTNLGEV